MEIERDKNSAINIAVKAKLILSGSHGHYTITIKANKVFYGRMDKGGYIPLFFMSKFKFCCRL